MGLFDGFQGFGESLEDWGGGAGMYGFGNMFNDQFSNHFKGLDYVGFPAGGGQTPAFSAFRGMDRSIPNLSEGYYQGFLNRAGGDYSQAFENANAQRWTMNPNDIALRNAEHGLFAQSQWNAPGIQGIYGKLMTPFAIPAYTGVKAAVQNMPFLAPAFNEMFGKDYDLTRATPASWQEMYWGLRPFWGHN